MKERIVCRRCTLLTFRALPARSRGATAFVERGISTSSVLQQDGDSKPSSKGIEQVGTSVRDAMNAPARLKITRVPGRQGQSQSQVQGLGHRKEQGQGQLPMRQPSGTQVIRRAQPSVGANQQLPRTGTNDPPPGQVLRRTSRPPQAGQVLQRTGTARARPPPSRQGQGQRPGQRPGQRGPPGKGQQDRRRRRAGPALGEDAENNAGREEAADEYIKNYIDRPENPTENLPYKPKKLSLDELRADWPNTPLSPTGLSEGMVQKIEWLARRLPHGYQTPEQLAEQFNQGNLTKFESEEEKQKVLSIATELAKVRAEKLTERKGEQIAAEDMSISDLKSSNADKDLLFGETVKGNLIGSTKQRHPFLDNVARNLVNNETYNATQSARFMARIQALFPQHKGQQRV